MLDKLTKEICLDHALQKQHRSLQRYVHKPEEMVTATFYTQLVELNEQFLSFPDTTSANKLNSDKLKEILEFILPKHGEYI